MSNEEVGKTVGHGKLVRVHIDERRYESASPTTCDALYALGEVDDGLMLYREVGGDREDEAIFKSPDPIYLKEDEHFHSGKPRMITIIVTGTPHEWSKHSISYTEVVTLYDPTFPQHPDTTYSVKYKKGPAHNPEGILAPGASVKVKDGMVFNVSPTGQS